MNTLWKIILSIAFGIVLLEILVLFKKGNVFEFTGLRIASFAGIAAAIYYFIFERKKRVK